ncbi:MAG: cyclic nucleotide-binding protein, partial [Actinomycetia bacterium]|nr:cyclic nucleotide-binding protein [Actinomycetes bacterium]
MRNATWRSLAVAPTTPAPEIALFPQAIVTPSIAGTRLVCALPAIVPERRRRHGVTARIGGVSSCTFVSGSSGAMDGFVGALTAAQRDRLFQRGTRRRYRRGSTLFLEGDRSDHVVMVLEGRVRVSVASADGRDLVVAVRGPGDVIGEFAAIDPTEPRSASAHAMEPVLVHVLSAADFEAFLEQTPRAAVALLRTLIRRLRDASRSQMEYGSFDTVARVARRLEELVADHGEATDDGVRIALPLTQEELAGWVGASRESVAR